MKTLPITLLTWLFILSLQAEAQQFKWAKGGGTTSSLSFSRQWEHTAYMCTDVNGNVYALSQVGANLVVADTFHSPTLGSDQNILITSYTCNGQMRWAKLIASGDGECTPDGIIADSFGHLYVSGCLYHFGGLLKIGTDTTLSSWTYQCQTLIQFDTSGNYNWLRYVGDNSLMTYTGTEHYGSALALDATNNIHFFNYIESGVHITPTLTSTFGTYDLVYDVSGTLVGSTRIDLDSEWLLNGAVIDPATNKLYISGEIDQSIFGGFLTDTFFAAAFDAGRHELWQYYCGHGNDDAISGIGIDNNKFLYFPGAAQATPHFSFHGDSVTGSAEFMAIIMKTDTNGNVKWIKHFDNAGTSINNFSSVTMLPNNKVAALGTFVGITTDGTHTLTTPPGEGYSPYLVVLDTGENLLSINQIHGYGSENMGNAIASDKAGNLYLGGSVADSIWAGSPSVGYQSTGGNTDFFVMKYGVDCNCVAGPISYFNSSGTTTVTTTYTGTTTGLDSVVWNFSDGTTAYGLSAAHTYIAPGIYHICATVYTTCGSDIYCKTDTIYCLTTPIAAFTQTGTHILSTSYTGTTAGTDSVRWSFGDGTTAAGTTAAHTYAATGIYEVCTMAYSHCGNDTVCHYDTVSCIVPPVASFTSTGSHTINVTYTGTVAGVDSVGWLFGDGSRSSGTTAAHTYAAPGIYNVCVIAHSQCGNDTACRFDTVVCVAAPFASFTDTGVITVGTTYTGTTAGVDSIAWNFGDGSSTITGSTALHTYSATGAYLICVTAYSPCGSNSICMTDTVLCISPPVASFTDTGSHILGFVYTGTTTDIDSVAWTFGDGHSATGLTAIHSYTASGTYHVCVTSYTGCGLDSFCRDIVVHVPNSVAIISGTGNVQVFPNPANDELNITGLTETTSYRILTVTSTCVLQGSLHQGSGSISMYDLVPGVYVLELVGLDGERNMVRVVKE